MAAGMTRRSRGARCPRPARGRRTGHGTRARGTGNGTRAAGWSRRTSRDPPAGRTRPARTQPRLRTVSERRASGLRLSAGPGVAAGRDSGGDSGDAAAAAPAGTCPRGFRLLAPAAAPAAPGDARGAPAPAAPEAPGGLRAARLGGLTELRCRCTGGSGPLGPRAHGGGAVCSALGSSGPPARGLRPWEPTGVLYPGELCSRSSGGCSSRVPGELWDPQLGGCRWHWVSSGTPSSGVAAPSAPGPRRGSVSPAWSGLCPPPQGVGVVGLVLPAPEALWGHMVPIAQVGVWG